MQRRHWGVFVLAGTLTLTTISPSRADGGATYEQAVVAIAELQESVARQHEAAGEWVAAMNDYNEVVMQVKPIVSSDGPQFAILRLFLIATAAEAQGRIALEHPTRFTARDYGVAAAGFLNQALTLCDRRDSGGCSPSVRAALYGNLGYASALKGDGANTAAYFSQAARAQPSSDAASTISRRVRAGQIISAAAPILCKVIAEIVPKYGTLFRIAAPISVGIGEYLVKSG